MQKTKLGISAAFLGALVYIFGLFSGLSLLAVVTAGYILLCEESDWLKRNATRAIVLLVVFNIVYFILGLLPNAFGFIADIIRLFDSSAAYEFVNSEFMIAFGNLTGIFTSMVSFVSEILFILLAVLALLGKDFKIPLVDSIVIK